MILPDNRKTIDFINDEKIPYVFVDISIKDGRKIQEPSPVGWKTWTYDECIKWNKQNKTDHHNAMCINVNKSRFMIIDIDTNPDKYLKMFCNGVASYKTLSFSKSLPHLWRLKHENDFSKNGKNDEKEVDYIYSHIYEKIDSIMYNCCGEIEYFNFEADHLNPVSRKPEEKAISILPIADILSKNVFYDELKYYTDNNAFIDRVQQGTHTEWISLGGLFKSILSEQDAKELFINVTNNGGTENKQKEADKKWNDIIQLNDDPLYAMNIIRKQIKKAKPTINKNWNEKRKEEAKQQSMKFKEQQREAKELENECKQEARELKAREKELKIRTKQDNEELKNKNKEIENEQAKYRLENNIFVDSDLGAINIIYERICDKFIYAQNVMFYKHGNIWINKPEDIIDTLKLFILNSDIYKSNEMSNLIPYCENIKNVKNVLDGLFSKLRMEKHDNNLYSKFHLSTKNKLCFIDGVLDFIKKKFILWKDVPKDTIYTTIIINRNYEEYFYKPNRDFIDKWKNNVMGNLFDTKLQDVIEFLSRAITGNIQDKNFMSYCGNRDCGKGVLSDGIGASIGEYYKPFDIENMLCKRENMKSSDLEKENKWLLPLEFARIAISNETADNENNNIKEAYKISNKVLKSVTGGDVLKGRLLRENPRDFTIDATIIALGNSELTITGSDSMIHHLKTKGVKQFVTQEKYDKERLEYGNEFVSSYSIRSETIKSDVLNVDYCNAFIHLMYENYKPIAITIKNDIEDDTEKSIRQLIFMNYTITKDDKDRIERTELYKLIGKDEKKILAELIQLNCNDKDLRIKIDELQDDGTYKSKKVRAFSRLKLKVAEYQSKWRRLIKLLRAFKNNKSI